MSLLLYLGSGIVLGLLYFRALLWNAESFASDGASLPGVALLVGRFGMLGFLLLLAALQGALPLLVSTLGLLIGRALLMRRVRLTATLDGP